MFAISNPSNITVNTQTEKLQNKTNCINYREKMNTYIRVYQETKKTDERGTGKVIIMRNPLLEPIHGISLYDYAAVSAKMSSGTETNEICMAFGIEPAIFEEASAIWITRMQKDNTFELTQLFARYFGEADLHPKLKNLQANSNTEGISSLIEQDCNTYP